MESVQQQHAPNSRCFGCGPANEQGLRIASFPTDRDGELVARFTPEPQPTLAFPHDDLGLSYAAYRAQYVAFNAITRSVAADLGVPVVDLDAIVPRDRAHLYDYVHLTAAGSRLVAEALADTLATRALPPSP